MGDAYDVAVVGGGVAGMTAASVGASVLLAEAASALGGALALSGGSFLAAGTPVQKRAGYEDSADRLFDYFVTFSQWRVEPAWSGPTATKLQRASIGWYRSGSTIRRKTCTATGPNPPRVLTDRLGAVRGGRGSGPGPPL